MVFKLIFFANPTYDPCPWVRLHLVSSAFFSWFSLKALEPGTKSSQTVSPDPVEWSDDALTGLFLPHSVCCVLEMAWGWKHRIFLYSPLSIPSISSLKCLSENLQYLYLAPNLWTSILIHICNWIWPQYPLDIESTKWLPNSLLGSSIIQDLYNYCRQSWN